MNFITTQGDWYKEKANQLNNVLEEIVFIHHEKTPFIDFFKSPNGFRWALRAYYHRSKPIVHRMSFLDMFKGEPACSKGADGKIRMKFIKRGE